MMRHPVSKDLFAYWNGLRGARAAPDRSDIDPAAIRHVLADSFIIEVDSACLFPIRLCGTRVNALRMSEQKGESFLGLWTPEDRRSVAAALLTVVDGATPIVAGARSRSPLDAPRQDMTFELLLLPLRHFGKTHSRLLGSLAPCEQKDWFGKVTTPGLDLVSMRVIRPNETPAPGLKRAPALSSSNPRSIAPRLVVYQGGKSQFHSGLS